MLRNWSVDPFALINPLIRVLNWTIFIGFLVLPTFGFMVEWWKVLGSVLIFQGISVSVTQLTRMYIMASRMTDEERKAETLYRRYVFLLNLGILLFLAFFVFLF